MTRRELSIPAQILLYLFTAVDLLPRPFESKLSYYKRTFTGRVPYQSFANALNALEKRGIIKIYKESAGDQFIKLTQKGQLETLLIKARLNPATKKWDGKWRLVIFDIPEDSREKRAQFRSLLKKNNFVKLQASVFISPFSLNREAIEYLKQSGLIAYIRILKVEEMDYDKNLRKHFKLPASKPTTH